MAYVHGCGKLYIINKRVPRVALGDRNAGLGYQNAGHSFSIGCHSAIYLNLILQPLSLIQTNRQILTEV